MTNILVTEPETYSDESLSVLKKIGKVEARRITRDELLKIVKRFDVLVIRMETRVDKKLLDKAKRLKILATGTTGLDHIDLEYAKHKKIKVISLKGVPILKEVPSTAEHTFALLLALIRRIPWAFDSVKKGEWFRSRFFGYQLTGRTFGIIGFGRLGWIAAKIAKGFGMKVIAFDPHVEKTVIRKAGVLPVPFKDLLKKSDVVSIHATLTPETENMIGYEQFKLMKRGAVLINTARGKIVDESALLLALKNKLIAGAALDVLSNEAVDENPAKRNLLVKYARSNDNLIITPHLGGGAYEAQEMTGAFLVQRVKEAASEVFKI